MRKSARIKSDQLSRQQARHAANTTAPTKAKYRSAKLIGSWIGITFILVVMAAGKQMMVLQANNFYYQSGWLPSIFPTSAYFSYFILHFMPVFIVASYICWHIMKKRDY